MAEVGGFGEEGEFSDLKGGAGQLLLFGYEQGVIGLEGQLKRDRLVGVAIGYEAVVV